MIRVLVVEDSPVMRELLVHILSLDPELCVVAAVDSGEAAITEAARLKPDVITMDFHLPSMDGFAATKQIMQESPTPVLVVSSRSSSTETAWAFRALEAGALAVVEKPAGPGHPQHEKVTAELLRTVKLMSEVKVVRRRPARVALRPRTGALPLGPAKPEIVAIGASTGGPPALNAILSRLPRDFPVPIVVVQHISPGFIEGFVQWLALSCPMALRVASHGMPLLPGCVYLAPDARHMEITSRGSIALVPPAHGNSGICPSVAVLFRSIAQVFGARAVGVLLTGMGKDGAEELKLIRERGGLTFAQDRDSAVVHGMPGEAIRLGAADYELSPAEIAEVLIDCTGSPRIRRGEPI